MIKRIVIGTVVVIAALVAGVVIFGVMRHRAGVRQTANSPVEAAPVGDFGATERLSILPLVEAAAVDAGLRIEHGVSYLVVTDEATILFDVGGNLRREDPSPLAANMDALGIAAEDIDLFVLSHPHFDHTGGLLTARAASDGPPAGPDLSGIPVFVPEAFFYGGTPATVTTEPTVLAEGVATSGTLLYGELFPMSLAGATSPEQMLVVNVAGQGIVLISGCGHPTLTRMVAQAETAFDEPVVGVIGGLHLGDATADDLADEIALMKGLNPVVMGLSPHDSGPAAIEAFRGAFPDVYRDVSVGQAIEIGA
jgi:7,8-dihydropterin-6-yl-methyl-4-(beta-D-ribofuranosyl)aminobenzene 5'-phosphate synthase